MLNNETFLNVVGLFGIFGGVLTTIFSIVFGFDDRIESWSRLVFKLLILPSVLLAVSGVMGLERASAIDENQSKIILTNTYKEQCQRFLKKFNTYDDSLFILRNTKFEEDAIISNCEEIINFQPKVFK